jgi:fatty acid desaturase
MRTKDNILINSYLKKRSDSVSFFQLAAHLLMAFLPLVFMIAFPFKLHNILLIILFGVLMNGVINLMHECAHYHVFNNRIYNILFGKWILGPLFFANFETYRQRHWEHHKFIGSDKDPKDAYLVNIHGRNILFYFIICLTGIEALKKFVHQLKKNPDERISEKQSTGWIGNLFLFHLFFSLILFSLSFFFHKDLYQAIWVFLYVYIIGYVFSIMSVTIFIATLRAIAEHQIMPGSPVIEGHASVHNFNCSSVSRIIFGSYGFGEHLTHHEYPAIPYYQLKKATSELSKADPKYIPTGDYPGILYKIITHE